jgi:23S rRNA (adenine2503-C2)-methyltransferase
VNDSLNHARNLVRLLRGIDAHVNLIPLNPTDEFSGAASVPAAVDQFQSSLRAAGLPATVRQKRGIDVVAGCGQLSSERTARLR